MLTQLMPVARVKVLAFLLLNASEECYLREIARRAGVPLRAAQRELAILDKIGLVHRSRRGSQVFFHVEIAHPLFADLRAILLKSDGLAAPLREALERVPGVEAAVVYGSVASGTDTGKSDIDLLVVGSADAIALHDVISQVEDRIGRPISYTLLTRRELSARKRKKEPFLARVLSGELIPVLGDVRGV
ncbi:MAG: nucleotidyltransferase domain-containing protein [Thermoanaerobaculales bacterium]